MKQNDVSCIEFAETCKAGGKCAKGDYQRKYLLIVIVISDLSILQAKI